MPSDARSGTVHSRTTSIDIAGVIVGSDLCFVAYRRGRPVTQILYHNGNFTNGLAIITRFTKDEQRVAGAIEAELRLREEDDYPVVIKSRI